MVQHSQSLPPDIGDTVTRALEEDQGCGDLTAGLIAEDATAKAQVTVGMDAVLCGRAWFDEVFRQLDKRVIVNWNYPDGASLGPEKIICNISGPARPILTGERTALNFLQTLSGTATTTRYYVAAIAGTAAQLLDTRKTIPGLRLAQKYAVRCGGGENHRMGLYDAVLIKENHIAAAGGVEPAAHSARRQAPEALIEIEAETLVQVREALAADIDRVLLDNFSIESLHAAIAIRDALDGRRIAVEASGGIDIGNIRDIADTGVDFIEDHGWYRGRAGADHFERQADTRQLAAGRDPGQRPEWLAGVEAHLKLNAVQAVRVGPLPRFLGQIDVETAVRQAQLGELCGNEFGELRCAPGAALGQLSGRGEIGVGCGTHTLGKVLQRFAASVECAGPGLQLGVYAGESRLLNLVLAGQFADLTQAVLDPFEALRIGFEAIAITGQVGGRLAELNLRFADQIARRSELRIQFA